MKKFQSEFIQAGEKIYTVQDLYEILERLQIGRGDVLCVHSQIFSFGRPLVSKENFLKIIISVLKKTVGENGILIMPAFSYSFCRNEVFDVRNTPSTVGLLSEYFRKSDGVIRSLHPIFSFSVWGNRKEEYIDIGPDAFGLDSIYGKMLRDNGKILMFGANKGYTFYHLAEEHVNVRHRYFKNFSGEMIDAEGNRKLVQVPYFVRDLSIKSDLDEKKISFFLLENNLQNQVTFGKGTIGVLDCREVYKTLIELLKVDERRFL